MRHSILKATLIALAVACACGGGEDSDSDGNDVEGAEPIPDPLDFCGEMGEAICDKIMACYSAEERALYGMAASLEECLDMTAYLCDADNVCEDGTTYDPDNAGSCLVEVEAMSCDVIRSPSLEPGPACSAMCQ